MTGWLDVFSNVELSRECTNSNALELPVLFVNDWSFATKDGA